jgi:hypothetical protein
MAAAGLMSWLRPARKHQLLLATPSRGRNIMCIMCIGLAELLDLGIHPSAALGEAAVLRTPGEFRAGAVHRAGGRDNSTTQET